MRPIAPLLALLVLVLLAAEDPGFDDPDADAETTTEDTEESVDPPTEVDIVEEPDPIGPVERIGDVDTVGEVDPIDEAQDAAGRVDPTEEGEERRTSDGAGDAEVANPGVVEPDASGEATGGVTGGPRADAPRRRAPIDEREAREQAERERDELIGQVEELASRQLELERELAELPRLGEMEALAGELSQNTAELDALVAARESPRQRAPIWQFAEARLQEIDAALAIGEGDVSGAIQAAAAQVAEARESAASAVFPVEVERADTAGRALQGALVSLQRGDLFDTRLQVEVALAAVRQAGALAASATP